MSKREYRRSVFPRRVYRSVLRDPLHATFNDLSRALFLLEHRRLVSAGWRHHHDAVSIEIERRLHAV